jgi:hypothetical protein
VAGKTRVKMQSRRGFSWVLSTPDLIKDFSSVFQNHVLYVPIPPCLRGVSRSSRTLSAGCDGRVGLQRGFRADEQHDTHGEIVWFWHPGADAKSLRC